jgi:hypothetical protein
LITLPTPFYFETYWGTVLFSSYSDGFWGDRLRGFEIQSAHGHMGTMDDQATGNGVIVSEDGSPATTVNAAGFALEFRLRWSSDGVSWFREIVRQQWYFSHA